MDPTNVRAKLDDGTVIEEELEAGPLADLFRAAWRVVTGMPWFEALYGLPCSHFGVRVTHRPVRQQDDRLTAFKTDVEIAVTTDPTIDQLKLNLGKRVIKRAYEDLLQKQLSSYGTQHIRKAISEEKKVEFCDCEFVSVYQIPFSVYECDDRAVKGSGPSWKLYDDIWRTLTLAPGFTVQHRLKPEDVSLRIAPSSASLSDHQTDVGQIRWKMEADSASVTAHQETIGRSDGEFRKDASLYLLIHPKVVDDGVQLEPETCCELTRALTDALSNSFYFAAEYRLRSGSAAAAFDVLQQACDTTTYDSTLQDTQESPQPAGTISGSAGSQHTLL